FVCKCVSLPAAIDAARERPEDTADQQCRRGANGLRRRNCGAILDGEPVHWRSTTDCQLRYSDHFLAPRHRSTERYADCYQQRGGFTDGSTAEWKRLGRAAGADAS